MDTQNPVPEVSTVQYSAVLYNTVQYRINLHHFGWGGNILTDRHTEFSSRY